MTYVAVRISYQEEINRTLCWPHLPLDMNDAQFSVFPNWPYGSASAGIVDTVRPFRNRAMREPRRGARRGRGEGVHDGHEANAKWCGPAWNAVVRSDQPHPTAA